MTTITRKAVIDAHAKAVSRPPNLILTVAKHIPKDGGISPLDFLAIEDVSAEIRLWVISHTQNIGDSVKRSFSLETAQRALDALDTLDVHYTYKPALNTGRAFLEGKKTGDDMRKAHRPVFDHWHHRTTRMTPSLWVARAISAALWQPHPKFPQEGHYELEAAYAAVKALPCMDDRKQERQTQLAAMRQALQDNS